MRADPLLVGTLLVFSLPASAAAPAPAPAESVVADATDPAEDPVASLHGEIGELAHQIAQLRAQVSAGWPAPDPEDESSDGALIHSSPPAPPPEPPSSGVQREAQIVAAQADLVAARQRLARLQALVAGGIDGDLLAPSVADAEARVGTLEAALVAAEADGGTSSEGPSSGAGESLAGAPPPDEVPVAEVPIAEAPASEEPASEVPAAEEPAAEAAQATADPVPAAGAPITPTDVSTSEAAESDVVADAETTSGADPSAVASVASVVSPAEPAASVCTLSVGLGSAYVFRGLNVLSEGSPEDQDGIVAPAARCGIGSTGLSVGYWGAYQVSGANAHAAVQAGLGNEQDIILGFDRTVGDHGVGLSASVVAYVYPFADPEVAGTASPLYLEPGVGLRTSGDVVVSYKMSYMIGVQDAVAASRYMYMNPSIARAWTLADGWELGLTASAGLKAYITEVQPTDNIVDVQLDAVVPHAFSERFAVAPGVHGAASHAGGEPTFTAWLSLDSNFNL